MRLQRLRVALGALVLLAALPIVAVAQSHVHAAGSQTRAHAMSAHALISTYYDHINADFQSGTFTDLAMFYAPNAVFTVSNPAGVTKVYVGLAAITGYYKGLYAKLPSLHFGLTSERSLSPTILLRYEHGTAPSLTVGPRCAHLFVVTNGLIQTDDWVAYFGGK